MAFDCRFTCISCEGVEWRAPKLSDASNVCFICGGPGKSAESNLHIKRTNAETADPADVPEFYDEDYPHYLEQIDTPHWSMD